MNSKDYEATVRIIQDIQNLIDVFSDSEEERYTMASKKLAAKILTEWSADLKRQSKKKKELLRIAYLLEGYAQFLI